MSTIEEFTATMLRPAANERTVRRLGAVTLAVLEGPAAPARHEVHAQRAILGRGPFNDISIDDSALSLQHVEIMLATDHVVVRDLDSRNGTWIGSARVLDRVGLPDGAEFCAGNSRFQIHFAGNVDVPLSLASAFEGMHGTSDAMREIFALLQRLAPTPLSTLVVGETGCGKEEVARALHAASGRKGPFVVLDCGALPRELAEAAILGYRKGAFTGAVSDHAGCFEEADTGTLFLDEIGELPLDLQPKLLRVLDRREVQRIGEHGVRTVDVRIISATHRDLRAQIADQRFRLDLFHRLDQVTIHVAPLRDRPEDIELLVRHFARAVTITTGRTFEFADDALTRLRALHWEGNVRQLKHVIERACYLAPSSVITRNELFVEDAPRPGQADEEPLFALPLKDALQLHGDAFARRYCERLLASCSGDLDEAAKRAQYSRKGLRELMKRLGFARI